MALGSRAWRSPCVNTPVDPAGELDELAGTQGPAKRSNAGSDEAPTKAPTPPEAPTPPLVPPTSENLFTKFMKVFIESPQAQTQHNRRHESATPITWSEFKAFLRKDLGSSQAFIDSIWSKFRRDSQYQLEEARDWASHLQHLQSILSKFDPIRTLDKLTMICYFREGLKLSIKVEMEQQDREAIDFEEMVQKVVNADAKAGLRSSAMVRDSDIRCPQGHRFSNNTASKVQTQGTSAKEPRSEESRPKEAKPAKEKAPALPWTNATESLEQGKKDRKDKKRKFWEKTEQTPATGTNVTNAGSKKKYPDITCYNCDKKGHYLKSCPEPPKN